MYDDTIAAISTAYGEGGIGIVRMSGPDSFDVLKRIFVPGPSGRTAGEAAPESDSDAGCRADGAECFAKGSDDFGGRLAGRRLTYGYIRDPETGADVDEVLCVFMRAPRTYTAEDVVEIDCHGSVVSLRKILALTLRYGARLAEPGEFTRRAFMNGRLDLSQAEAVIDLIKAKTDTGFDVAMTQLEGGLSDEVGRIRAALTDVLVEVAVNIDYPDEDIEELTYEKLTDSLLRIGDMIEKLRATADTGRIVRDGLKVAIVGKPNVGKSSLMNALLRESRAIVTEIPGTTRDTIEEQLSVRGIPVVLTDTAGIRRTEDTIERIGIERSKESFNRADLIVFMLDASAPLTDEDREIASRIGGRQCLAILNKTDIGSAVSPDDVLAIAPGGNVSVIRASVRTGEGVDLIEKHIEDLVYGGKARQSESLLVTNARHADLLEKAAKSVGDAVRMADAREALDFIQLDVNDAYTYLGEISGETAADDIIDEVFRRFCLGK